MRLKYLFTSICLLISLSAIAQSPKKLFADINKKFDMVNNYNSDLRLDFDIPFVKIKTVNAKAKYSKPDKFDITSTSLLFLPKQKNLMAQQLLRDTNSFTAVLAAEETINGVKATVINVIPNKEDDLILGKFWIDKTQKLILKSQLTTKSNGMVTIENTFGKYAAYALPDKMKFTVDVAKFKIPKALVADIGSNVSKTATAKPQDKGTITLNFSNYVLNKK